MVLLKMDLPGHCHGPFKNWTSPVTVMVLLNIDSDREGPVFRRTMTVTGEVQFLEGP